METAGSPRGGRDLPSAAIMRTPAALAAVRVRRGRRRVSTARRGRSADSDPARGGLRVWQSVGLPLLLMLPCRCRCGPAGCVAVAVRSIAAMPLWGAYAVAVTFLWHGIGIYTLSHKKRPEGVLEALRAIDICARISGGQCRTCRDAHRRRRTRKSPAGHTSGRGKKKAAHAGRQRGYESRAIQTRIRTGSSRAYNRITLSPPAHSIAHRRAVVKGFTAFLRLR